MDETKEVEVTDAEEAVAATDAVVEPQPKKKKWPIVVGVVAVVLVAAVAGLWIWHEQPSFCSAICHTPMDPYLVTYNAEPGESATDKWGNEVEDASSMMAALHRSESGTTCLDCHVPTLSEQINEGIEWITGNYEVAENETYGYVLYETTLADLVEARGIDEEAFCMNESCHTNADGTVMTRDDLIALTAEYTRNPHGVYQDSGELNAHTVVTCSQCHKAHRASVNYCTTCHADAPLPDGWLTVAQAKKLTNQAK